MNFRSDEDVRADPDIRMEADPVIQSQYYNSAVIRRLAADYTAKVDPTPDESLFYHSVVNILTAREWGLENWGRILVLPRLLYVQDEEVFGFAGSGLQPFNRGTFYNDGAMSAYLMPDKIYRAALFFKALANISSCDAATLNTLMALLFTEGRVYVVETGIMAIRYIFEFTLEPWQRALMRSYGLLARGAGVRYEWYEIDPVHTFGFAGSGFQPFDQGVFSPGLPVRPVVSKQA